GLADDALSREGGALLRPYAFYTLCRGALISGSQAVWVMTGPRETRLYRTRVLELEDLKGQITFLNDYLKDAGISDDVSEKALQSMRSHLGRAESRKRELEKQFTSRKSSRPTTTGVIRDVANHLSKQAGDD